MITVTSTHFNSLEIFLQEINNIKARDQQYQGSLGRIAGSCQSFLIEISSFFSTSSCLIQFRSSSYLIERSLLLTSLPSCTFLWCFISQRLPRMLCPFAFLDKSLEFLTSILSKRSSSQNHLCDKSHFLDVNGNRRNRLR